MGTGDVAACFITVLSTGLLIGCGDCQVFYPNMHYDVYRLQAGVGSSGLDWVVCQFVLYARLGFCLLSS